MTDDGKTYVAPECTAACGLRDAIDRGFADMRAALAESSYDRADLRAEVNALKATRDKPSEPDMRITVALEDEIAARKALDAKVDKLIALADRAEAWWRKATANKYLKAVGIALAVWVIRYLENHGANVSDVVKGVLP